MTDVKKFFSRLIKYPPYRYIDVNVMNRNKSFSTVSQMIELVFFVVRNLHSDYLNDSKTPAANFILQLRKIITEVNIFRI